MLKGCGGTSFQKGKHISFCCTASNLRLSVAYNNKHLFFSLPGVQVSWGSSASDCGSGSDQQYVSHSLWTSNHWDRWFSWWMAGAPEEWVSNACCMFYMPASTLVSSAAFLQLAKATTWPCQRQCWGKIESSSSCGNPETSHRKRLEYIILIQESGELVAIIQATTELIMENIGE